MTIGWGVVSTGRAADVLVGPAINAAEGSKIVAVFSRDQARADEYAKTWEIGRGYGSYEALLADDEVDLRRRVSAGNHLAVDVGRRDDSPLDCVRHCFSLGELNGRT